MWVWLAGASVALAALCAAGWFTTYRRLRAATTSPGTDRIYHLAEDAASFGVWTRDLTSDVTILSAGAARLTGLPPVAGPHNSVELRDLIHPDDRSAAVEEFMQATSTGTGFQSDFRVRMADGSYEWRRSCGRRETAAGAPPRVVGAFIDIHEEKLILDQLAKNAERLALAEDVAGFGVWELDVTTNAMTLSAGAAALSGFERAAMQVTGEQLVARIHPDDMPMVG